MTTTIEVHEKTDVILPSPHTGNNSPSAVSWGAIFAGAAGAAALSLILLILGTGLGFSAISPWANEGVSAKTWGISGILWITLTSIAASGMGGYLAGRLRTRWAATQRDEIYFRDTAHGFLAWAIATLFTAALLTSTIGVIVTGGAKAGANLVSTAATTTAAVGANADRFGLDGESTNYFIDSLFRRPASTSSTDYSATQSTPLSPPAPTSAEPVDGSVPVAPSIPAPAPSSTLDVRDNAEPIPSAEVARIFMNALRTESLPDSDAEYVAQLVAERTDLSAQEAEQRVKDTFNQWQQNLQQAETTAKEVADDARKATAYLSLWFFISLLIGAFTASWLATFGGRQRDL